MRGLYCQGGSCQVRDDLPEPVAGVGETTVDVLVTGVCATDLALRRGYMGFSGVPGHEFVGRAIDGPLAGQRVVGEINAGCGTCPDCRAGDPRHCARRTVLGILGRSGAFAERLVLPTANLIAVPDHVSDEVASFTEPLAAALQIPTQLDIPAGTPALVAGDGRLGLLCAHALHRAGARVCVAGRHPERAALLPAGVEHVTGLLEDDARSSARTWPLAVEATGRPETLSRLTARMQPRGTIVLKSTSETPLTLDLSPLVVGELSLVGSRCGRFAPALELLASGEVPVARFVHDRFPLARADEALRRAAEPGVLKVLVDVGAGAVPPPSRAPSPGPARP